MRAALVACALAAGCQGYWVCEETDVAALDGLPSALSETGLFAEISAEKLGDGVVPYEPRFGLWSDDAAKRRWVYLPPGTQIDTSDMNSWSFPTGTKFWKEFSRDGVRVETRLFEKRGATDDTWVAVAYVWNADETDAAMTPFGAIDAHGTAHDVPAAGECVGCHGGRASRILGFSAIQLSRTAAPGEWDLATLAAAGRLSAPPAQHFELPGDAMEQAALGYLHANCAHCHNHERPPETSSRCFAPENEIDFFLTVDALAMPGDTATYHTAIGPCIKRGDPDGSRMIELVSHRGFRRQMPPLATEQVDTAAVELLRAWIARMGAR